MNKPLSAVLRGFQLVFVVAVATLLCFVRTGTAADPCAIPNFTEPANINLIAPSAIVVGDFNKDGKLDLAAANNRTSGTVSILLGDGSGGFSAPINFPGGRMPTSLVSGDLNGDGNADLVLGNQSNFQGEISILLGNGAGGFGTQTFIRLVSGIQNQIAAVAIGDVNSDGKPDLALTSATFNSVTILVGNGTGQFTVFKSFSAGGFSPNHSVMTDLNGDGKLDLAVANPVGANQSPGSVATLLGDGAGNFSTAVTFLTGTSPSSIAVGDFNRDSKADLAVTNNGSSNISVLLGDGAGNLSAATNYDARGMFPQAVVQGDFNGDGMLDLAVFNEQPGNAVIFSGDGAGTFHPVANFGAGRVATSAQVATVGDFNGDGKLDLAAVNEFPGAISVLLNTCGSSSSPQFQLNAASSSGSESDGVFGTSSATFTVTRTGDITGAATVDYATSNDTAIAPQDYTPVSGTLNFAAGETFKTVTIPLTNDNTNEAFEQFNVTLSNVIGNATLGSPSTSTIFIFDDDPVPSISINDVTIAEGNMGTTSGNFIASLSNPSALTITVNFTTAAGSATAGSDYQSTSGILTFNPGEISKNISVIVNGDNVQEVNETFFINLSTPANATLADSVGLGTIGEDDSACPAPSFAAPTDFTVGSNPIDLVVGDFNSDGKRDLAVANTSSSNVSLLLGNGGGDFSAATNFAVGNRPAGIAAADLNLDGKLDLVTANNDPSGGGSSISILLSNGAGTFAPASNQTPVANIRAVGIGDLNLDGKPDLAVVSSPPFIAASTLSILIGNGAGGFGAPTNYATGLSSQFVAVADLNGDSKLDLVTTNFQSSDVSILLNNGDGTFASATSIPVGLGPNSVSTGDLNGDGKLDLVVPNHATTGNVSVLLGNGSGGFSAGNSLTIGSRPYRTFAADLNCDSKLDLAVADPATSSNPPAGGVWVLFGNGMGSFTTPGKYAVGPERLAVVAGDFNDDGKLDLASTNFNSTNKVSILINTCPVQRPTIFVEEGSVDRALALDSVTLVRGPFRVLTDFNFSGDRHTRVILFTSDLGLSQPDPTKLTVKAGATSLVVENVGTVTGVSGLVGSYIIVRLPDGLPSVDLPLVVTLNGAASTNSPTLSISP